MCSDLYGMPALALCVAILLSCTVKEDRTECPCFLTVDLGGVESAALMGAGADSLIVQVQAEGDFYVREAFHLRDNVQEYTVAVPKTRTDVLVACTSLRAANVPSCTCPPTLSSRMPVRCVGRHPSTATTAC